MIRTKKKNQPIVVDLTGPQGNAYYLLSLAKTLSQQLDLDPNMIQTKMTSGDYDNLIQVFDQYFGSFVILEK